MTKAKMVAGILGGLAIGVTIGILFAPDKGSETRKKLVRRGKDCVDDIKETIHDMGSKLHKQPADEDED